MASIITIVLALWGITALAVAHRLRNLPKEKADRSNRVVVFGAPAK